MSTNLRSSRLARRSSAVALLALTVSLAACGSSSSSGSADTSSASSAGATATTAMAPTSEAMTPTSEAMTPTTVAAGGSATTATAMMDGKPFGPACATVPTTGAGSFDGMAKDPAATAASNNPVLSTLVTAVKAAGLVDTLNGPGPFTIFAPSNDAFAKIDAATMSKLLADPSGDLTKILTYHVVGGKALDAATLVKDGSEMTVNGGKVEITKSGDTYMVNGAKVLCGDITTANAKVFIIDSVLTPPAA
jgi:uncharacterized surface protein with fasciclin (FAS1) repeats